MIYRSTSQYSHMHCVPELSNLMAGQDHIVTDRVYRVCCCVIVKRELAMECWLDGMLRVRAKVYSACVSEDCGLSLSRSLF